MSAHGHMDSMFAGVGFLHKIRNIFRNNINILNILTVEQNNI